VSKSSEDKLNTTSTNRPNPTPPTVAAAEPRAWQRWVSWLLTRGHGALASLGLVLISGLVLGAGALLLFADLAEDVHEPEAQQIDQGILAALHQHTSPFLDQAAWFISLLGSEILAVLFFVTVAWLLWQRRYGAAISLSIVVVGAMILNDLLKLLIRRPRPAEVITSLPGQVWSFPSGHAMVSLAFYGFLAYLGWEILRGVWRVLWVASMVLLVLLIGWSRIYLGVHYFTDVVAGYVAGFIWLDSVILGGYVLTRRSTESERTVSRDTPQLERQGATRQR
jgi:undecaprenyl-diphosphatase